jgi:hypothetical protein
MKTLKYLALSVALLWVPIAGSSETFDRSGGPYVPTPQAVVDAMLDLASVGARDYVIDLGSGDGRIVLTAATRHKASGMGVDIDPELVDLANGSARKLGVAERVQFVRRDIMAADVGRASVVALYLLPGMMVNLQVKLLAELRPGTRIVSHDFAFDKWKPDRTVSVQTPEKYDMSGSWTSEVHLWIVPAEVQGAWRVQRDGDPGEPSRLEIRQNFQHFDARYSLRGRTLELRGQLNGSQLSFTVPAGNGGQEQLTGTVTRDRIQGDVRNGGAVVARWSATRVP